MWLFSLFYQMRYNYFRNFFYRSKPDCAVIWNGNRTCGFLFARAAQDCKIPCLYLERSPFADMLTIDPNGTNFNNSLIRHKDFYINWWQTQSNQISLECIKEKLPRRHAMIRPCSTTQVPTRLLKKNASSSAHCKAKTPQALTRSLTGSPVT